MICCLIRQQVVDRALENVTPVDVYYGRHRTVLPERARIKRLTMQRRKSEYRAAKSA